MPINQYNSSVRQMSQSKFNSMKNASGKIPDLANQIVMTNSEDENVSYLRTEVVYDMTSSDASKNDDKMIMRKASQKELDEQKLAELTNWFDNYFDKQLNQSLWQDDFTVSHDDYFNKDYNNIDELKAQAKIVRNEIRELRK